MLGALGQHEAELSILLCDDETIAELNEAYRAKRGPTDVLAFAMSEGMEMVDGDEAPSLLGDVIISQPTARAQAAAAGRSLSYELTFLLAHGLLHLVGYDHRDDAEEAEMTSKTMELMEAVGMAKPAKEPSKR